MASLGHGADYREIKRPLLENGLCEVFTPRLEHHEHPLLRFREHHFIGRHAGLTARHFVHIKLDTNAALACHFDA